MSTHHQPWRRVYDPLKRAIEQGELAPDDQIDSTRALAERHKVAPMTVRRALRELQEHGLAKPVHGVGWFVTTPPPPEPDLQERVSALETEVQSLRARLDHDSTVSQ